MLASGSFSAVTVAILAIARYNSDSSFGQSLSGIVVVVSESAAQSFFEVFAAEVKHDEHVMTLNVAKSKVPMPSSDALRSSIQVIAQAVLLHISTGEHIRRYAIDTVHKRL